MTRANVAQFIPSLLTELDKNGRSAATVAVIDGTTLFAGTTAFPQRAVSTMANEIRQRPRREPGRRDAGVHQPGRDVPSAATAPPR